MEGLSVLRSVASAVVGVAATGAFLASPAFADGGYPIYGDGGFKDEVHFAPPPITWTGFYIGFHAGYGWGDSDWKALDDFDPILAGDRFNLDPEGGVFGGYIGYNAQTGPVVWGIEASLSGADINESVRTTFGGLIDPPPIRFDTDIDTLWSVTGRIGYDWGRLLTYVKAGYAGADVELTITDPGLFRISDSKTHHGWTVGGGIEYLASENLVLGLEYNYYDFGEKDYGKRFTELPHGLIENDVQLHTVTARLSYKFGRRVLVAEPPPPLK